MELLLGVMEEETRHQTFRQILMDRKDRTILASQDEEEPSPIPTEVVDRPICLEEDEGLLQARTCFCLQVEDHPTRICFQGEGRWEGGLHTPICKGEEAET
jgi:hypothetical protein